MSDSEGPGVACVTVRWEDAADLGELWEGAVLDVQVAGEHVLLVRLPGGEVRAYQGQCPHQKMLLADGDFEAETGVLVCMGHLWEFDLREGVGINPAGCRLYTYPVEVVGDRVKIGIPQDGLRHYTPWRGHQNTRHASKAFMTTNSHQKMVGPVIPGADAELADAVIEAIEVDNPGADVQVEDAGGYIGIGVPQRCRLTRASLEEALGDSFELARLEPSLSAFAGRMKATDDEVLWYLERQD